jgi:hypothetical protein
MAINLVWVLVISHRHGDNMYVHETPEGAKASLVEYVHEWWGECSGRWGEEPEKMPHDDEEAVQAYFDKVGDEYYSLEQAAVMP